MERVQKVIANSGFCSRRKAEEYIQKGRVRINGEVIREMGRLVDGNDTIEVDGHTIEGQEKVYVLLNKPRGVVTTTSDELNRVVYGSVWNLCENGSM